jgi:hypothetical protein
MCATDMREKAKQALVFGRNLPMGPGQKVAAIVIDPMPVPNLLEAYGAERRTQADSGTACLCNAESAQGCIELT